MSNDQINKGLLKGGAFLIERSTSQDTFIPEEFADEQLMIKQMVLDFLHQDIFPNTDRLEHLEDKLSESLIEKLGGLGLLGTHMPEQFGGLELDSNVNTLISEVLGPAGGFTVTFAVQTGIGMLPILYFGTQEQKEKYLPKLISGELRAAYCLTEPGSGSDALAAKTRADLSADGTYYTLNGQKMWISNGGFADMYVVFAKIEGEKFTGFIVDRNSEGLTLGAEEKKMGIKASSTRQVFFENVKVPAGNVLGVIGKGHHIAFNSLNIGRFKLCAMVIGGAKAACSDSVRYATERIQFNQPISNFGAIQFKLAEQAIRTFAVESALYRVSDFLEHKKKALMSEGMSYAEANLKAAEEYAIECALLKVAGSEALNYVVDENVQVHGGMGFSEEGTAARAYRDARINRIYEGTNEINRLLAVDMLLKRALKGAIDIVGPAWEVQKELASMPGMEKPEGRYGEEQNIVRDFKKIILMVAGGAAKMQMDGKLNLEEEQEVIMNVADMMIDTFVAESLLLRVEKLGGMEKNIDQSIYDAILKTFLHDANFRMTKNATDAIASFTEGDLVKTFLMGLKRYTKYPAVNVKQTRRTVAQALISANKYCF